MKAPLPPNEAQRLETLRGYAVLDTPPEPAFDDLTLLAAQICQVPIALISLVDEDRQWFKSKIGLGATETPRDLAFCAHAILYSDEMLEVRDTQLDPRFANNPLVTADPHIRFYAGAPLVAPDGLALGTLCVIDREPRALSVEQQTALRALSRTVITQLELRRSLAARRRAEEQLESLNASLEQQVEARTAELRQEQQNLALAAKSSNTGLWSRNLLTNEANYSPEWKAHLGYLPDELPNHFSTWKSLIHPDDLAPAMQRMHEFLASPQEAYENEFRLRHRDGSYHWILARGSKQCDKNGKPIRLVGSHLDITERKEHEEQARRLLKENETILNNAVMGIVYLKQRRVVSCNRRLEEIFEYGPGELIGASTERFYDSRETFQQAGKVAYQLLAEGKHYLSDLRLRHKDGSLFWGLVTGRAVDPAHPHEGSIWIYSDITERKQAEEQLRIAAAAFESQEGMMVTDASSVILRVNKAFTEITGYTAEEAVGQTPRLLRSGRHDADFYREMWETINRTGGWQGEIWDRRKNGEEYPKWLTISAVKGDNGAVTHYVGTHFDITERKQAEERINELAFFDQLTGLPNRTLLLDRLRQVMTASARSESYAALLFIDLDNFKTLNDTLGHDMGDLLLKQVAQRLTLCVREGDTVARLGGDEFVLVLTSLSTSEQEAAISTETVAEKILAALNQLYQLGDAAHHSSASVGATLFMGHLATIDDLMKQADLAMYKAKEAGRNVVRFFDPAMETAVMRRAAMETDLRAAVDERQFLLHYQAQVADQGRLTGAEVLVRWQHPQRGLVSPAEFIPLAEETGLILPLGHWVLETACTQLAIWATRPEMADLMLAVNVSAHQFHQRDFVDQVLSVINNTGANPQRLKLELTESLLVSNVEEVIDKMFALKAKGVGFSLDDFGTGYSSLSYLKRLPLDQLKIDQSFVRDVLSDPNDAAIAKTIIALARSLELGVMAEGVETATQRDFLANSGCHAYQGYFFSRPLPLEAFEAFARRV